jgi:hypothetical protein
MDILSYVWGAATVACLWIGTGVIKHYRQRAWANRLSACPAKERRGGGCLI